MKDASSIPNIGNVTTNRPAGEFKDDVTPGDGLGTPARKDWLSDLYYSLYAILDEAGLTPDDSEEGVTTSQVRTALLTIISDALDNRTVGNANGNISVNNGNLNINLNAEKHNGLNLLSIDIGDWDMNTASGVNVPHGIDATKIRAVDASIRNDLNNSFKKLVGSSSSSYDGGSIGWDATNIVLFRITGGIFDSASFSSTPFNRGWITIWYAE